MEPTDQHVLFLSALGKLSCVLFLYLVLVSIDRRLIPHLLQCKGCSIAQTARTWLHQCSAISLSAFLRGLSASSKAKRRKAIVL